jgi:hypothetical protein
MQQHNDSGFSSPERIIRFVATFMLSAGAVMIGSGSNRFGTWEPWLLAIAGAALIMAVLYRQPVGELRNKRTNEPLFESATQRNVVFGAFMVVTFVILLLVGRLMAATM